MSDKLLWTSGVGGMQCDDCGDTTIVQAFGDYADDDPMDESVVWRCRECAEGYDEDLTS